MAAMRVHGYEYANHEPQVQLQGFDFRKLNPKSMRIMNRLTRVLAQYQDKYQQKAKDGVRISMRQIINAVFKGHIEAKIVNR